MPDIQSIPEKPAGSRKYGDFQKKIYRDCITERRLPTVTTDPNKLEEQARKHLDVKSYNYVAGGAGEKATMEANRLAFRQWKHLTLRPQARLPLLIAPTSVQSIFHPDKETGVARIAAEIGVPFVLSTVATSGIEEVARASGDHRVRFFQLYWSQDDEITVSILRNARSDGYTALFVTLDTWTLGWRPVDLDNAYLPSALGIGHEIGLSDPEFRRKFREKYHCEVEEGAEGLTFKEMEKVLFSGAAHTWEDLEFLRRNWDGPIVLKGIQHVDDARMAIQAGVDGIVVSSHGGWQLDGAVGSLEVLPEIADAVGDKVTVLFDSGVRTGVDIIKALCLGAKGVLIGRPFIYGLAINGKEGARDVLQGLLADLDQSMGLAGIQNLAGCNRSMVRKVQYGGDLITNH